jgi:polyisoprenoid-binding protein YceI
MLKTAVLKANVGKAFAAEGIFSLSIDATLTLHGKTVALKIDVVVAKVGDQLLVTSSQPVIINVADFGLNEGVDRLMAVAKLPSIARAAPVSFVLVFVP